MKLIYRLKIFIEYNELKPHVFEKLLGLGNGYLNNQLRNNASIGSDIIEKIKKYFPNLSLVWLITGQGEMLINNPKNEINILEHEFNEEQNLYINSNDFLINTADQIKQSIKELNNLYQLINFIIEKNNHNNEG